MKIIKKFLKEIFTFRKTIWLFLCGILFFSARVDAQQEDLRAEAQKRIQAEDKFIVKYGPQSVFSLPPQAEPQVKQEPVKKTPVIKNKAKDKKKHNKKTQKLTPIEKHQ